MTKNLNNQNTTKCPWKKFNWSGNRILKTNFQGGQMTVFPHADDHRQGNSGTQARIICFNKSFRRNCTISTGTS